MDPHSFARPESVRVRHVDLDLTLDFDARRVHGEVTLDLVRDDPAAPLLLDTHALEVSQVRAHGSERAFTLGNADAQLGQSLSIALEPGDTAVTVHYLSGAQAEALQWLDPDQTAGGRHPFLFTQGQSIFTRSWIPLQDTPGVRVTYSARIRAPEGLSVVMSAQPEGFRDGAWHFRLDQPVPSYLIALACGELEQRAISERCAVWAEPSVVEAAAYEFADTERMVQVCETLFGPYRWERYDILILPPSFPFGGMENPRLTFLTPTVLAGDRSLVAIIAHELAHSWSGNLITNATWSDFWLNEGFTVYCEKRIMEALYGVERADMEKLLDYDELVREIERDLQPWQTVLRTQLDGKHPDDGFSSIPYEKGALFLRRIEQEVGRERFEQFLTQWFDGHAFQSVTTDQFLAFFRAELPEAYAAIDVRTWIEGEGLPEDAPRPTSDAFVPVDAALAHVRSGGSVAELQTGAWVTQHWLHFLNQLPTDLGSAGMAALDEAFSMRERQNSEIRFAWLQLGIRQGYEPNRELLEAFLLEVGRRKFVKPLYEALAKHGDVEWARDVYQRARKGYHAWTRKGCEEALGLADG